MIEKAYARDRAERYPSVAHLVVALAPFAPTRSQPNIDRIARGRASRPVAGRPRHAPSPGRHAAHRRDDRARRPGGPPARGRGTLALESQTGPSWQQGALQGAPQQPGGQGYGAGPQQATGTGPNYGPATGHGPGQSQATGPHYSTGSGPRSSPPTLLHRLRPAALPAGRPAPPPPMGTAATAPNMERRERAARSRQQGPHLHRARHRPHRRGDRRLLRVPTGRDARGTTHLRRRRTGPPALAPPRHPRRRPPPPGAHRLRFHLGHGRAEAPEPATSTKVAVAPTPGKPVASAAASAKPTASTKPKSIFDDR